MQKKFSFLFFFILLLSLHADDKSPPPFPIDIVYLWVDGCDPDWIKIKNHYLQEELKQHVIEEDACSDNRFFDHEELKYSLRSLIQFAPFFHHIYIVTMHQRPLWFVDHPDITFIDHTDIFLNSENLPTFNSQAIESNLHRIPGLCEHFIYFNDDVFLGRPVSPLDFFTPEGNVKVLFEKGLTVSPNPAVQATLYRKAWVNSSALLDSYFIQEKRQRLCHAPFALRKSWIEEVEHLFPFVFANNASHRFRSAQDFNLINGLLQYIWKYQGKIEKGMITNQMVSIYGDSFLDLTQKDLSTLMQNPLHTFCIQDLMTKDSEKTRQELYRFFQRLFPTPAHWEPAHKKMQY